MAVMLTTTLDPGGRSGLTGYRPIRPVLLIALQHDAVDDAVTEMLFDHVVLGRYHWTVVANSLPLLLREALEVAAPEDWADAGRHLLDAGDGGDADEAPGSRRSDGGTVFDVALIRAFLRTVGEEVADRRDPDLRPALAAAAELGFDAGAVAAITERALKDLLGSATEEDWNIITGQLIAEAREVCGPAHGEEVAS
ncbi:MAG: hypothetical protein JSU06_00450 [Actinobacteria bacterium]|nr:hypothetical protein [Actinomycetota bacterium]